MEKSGILRSGAICLFFVFSTVIFNTVLENKIRELFEQSNEFSLQRYSGN